MQGKFVIRVRKASLIECPMVLRACIMLLRTLRRVRRGFSAMQWMLIAAVILLVVVGSVQFVGRESNTRLEETSGAVGDTSELKDFFK